jgi:two-component system OmpR family response regulator
LRLLLVEDDSDLVKLLRGRLENAGFAVDVATAGDEAEKRGLSQPYDIVLLDLGLPGRSGLDVLRAWRTAGNAVPVVILTARDAWHEKVDGFKAGADDYLAKPFHVEELLARIQAVLRRLGGRAESHLSVEGYTLDEESQSVIGPSGETIPLTSTEFRLLRYFMLHPGHVLSKVRLTEHVYASEEDPDSNVIEVYVNRLRQKIGEAVIQTRRGQGYVFGTAR